MRGENVTTAKKHNTNSETEQNHVSIFSLRKKKKNTNPFVLIICDLNCLIHTLKNQKNKNQVWSQCDHIITVWSHYHFFCVTWLCHISFKIFYYLQNSKKKKKKLKTILKLNRRNGPIETHCNQCRRMGGTVGAAAPGPEF